MQRKAISLFAGIGGCSLGFKWADYDILLAVDQSNDAVQTYRVNFPETTCWQRDLRTVTAQEILEAVSLQPGELDFLIGGPPCQGFSSAGARFWEDPRNELLNHYVRLLREIRPRWFLMENVEGLLTANDGQYIYELTSGFLEAGYHLRVHKVYSHWYGLPQVRKRVFVVGTTTCADFDFPAVNHFEAQDLFGGVRILSVTDAISDLPPAAEQPDEPLAYQLSPVNDYQRKLRGQGVRDHWVIATNAETKQRIKALDAGQTMKDLPESLQHPSFKRRAHRRVMDGTPTEKRGGAPSGLKRLVADEPCRTITSAATREFVHPTEDRFLTLRECARLQSFPDDFHFVGSPTTIIRLIGNAIPPLIAEKLARHFSACMPSEPIKTPMDAVQQRGQLLGYYLTKASSMSPALARTDALLQELTMGVP